MLNEMRSVTELMLTYLYAKVKVIGKIRNANMDMRQVKVKAKVEVEDQVKDKDKKHLSVKDIEMNFTLLIDISSPLNLNLELFHLVAYPASTLSLACECYAFVIDRSSISSLTWSASSRINARSLPEIFPSKTP